MALRYMLVNDWRKACRIYYGGPCYRGASPVLFKSHAGSLRSASFHG
jgi:hypothetical protein